MMKGKKCTAEQNMAKLREADVLLGKGMALGEVCRQLDQPRSTQSQETVISEEEELLGERILDLAFAYGRYGCRRVTGLLRNDGWRVNHKRVERIWRQEGLKVPQKHMPLWILQVGETLQRKTK